MLRAITTGWFSWRFAVVDTSDRHVGEMALSSWRERGQLTIDGTSYSVSREGWGAFVAWLAVAAWKRDAETAARPS